MVTVVVMIWPAVTERGVATAGIPLVIVVNVRLTRNDVWGAVMAL
jgi:hypothetical protein